MKRLSLVASLVLFTACGSGDERRLFARLVNGTDISQKLVVEGSLQRARLQSTLNNTLTFSQTITAPALGVQRVSVLHPVFEDDSLSLYEGDCLTFKALTRSRLIVGMQKGLFPDHDVECRITLEGADPGGNEGSVECSGLVIPEEGGEEAPVGDAGSVECSTP